MSARLDERKRKRFYLCKPAELIRRSGPIPPFIIATTVVAMGIAATINFLIKGITVSKKGEAEKIKLGSFPSLK
ncbi:MAG: hypothetical protein V1915_02600 [Candidatus Bathyarchaeota archaeon]